MGSSTAQRLPASGEPLVFGAVAQTGFSARLEQHLGRPVVAACAVRPPNSIAYTAGGAGLGAAIGSVVGDLLIAGVVVGVLLGNLLQWLTIRGSGLSLSMALVLTDDHLELVRLGLLGVEALGDGTHDSLRRPPRRRDEGRAAADWGCGSVPRRRRSGSTPGAGAAGPRRP